MSRQTRALLLILGLALVLLALAVLAYAVWPAPLLRTIVPVDPALLVPPGGAP